MSDEEFCVEENYNVMVVLISRERGKFFDHIPIKIPRDTHGRYFKFRWKDVVFRSPFIIGFIMIEISEYFGMPEPDYSRGRLDPIHQN